MQRFMTLGISITIFKWSKLAFCPCLLGHYFFSHDFQQVTALSTTTFCVVMERDGGYTFRYYIVYSFIQFFYYFSFFILLLLLLFYLLFLGETRQAIKQLQISFVIQLQLKAGAPIFPYAESRWKPQLAAANTLNQLNGIYGIHSFLIWL